MSDALEVVERFGAVVAAVMRFASGGAKQADQFSGLAFAYYLYFMPYVPARTF